MNIQFNYLYRDAGNFKNFGSVILANPEEVPANALESRIRRALIDDSFFVAEEILIPSLRFLKYLPHIDHDWHEFEGLSETAYEPNDSIGRTALALADGIATALHSRALELFQSKS